MPKSEAEILADILRPPENTLLTRLSGTTLTIITLVAVCLLFAVSWAQLRALETSQRAAGKEAHDRQVSLQQALNSARLSQAITAEFQVAGAGPGRPGGGDACALDAANRVMVGRESLSWADLGCMRAPPGLSETDAAFVAAANAIFALERFVIPLDSSDRAVLEHPAHATANAAAQALEDARDPRAKLVEARLHTVLLNAAGAAPSNKESVAACDAIADLTITPAQSLEVSVWQAECLRKLDPRNELALQRFEAAQQFLGTLRGRYVAPGASLCGSAADIGRTEATVAARVFNGLGMTIVTQGGDLDQAEAAINEAICFRRKAQQTASQVASSQENLAVIAYRRYANGESADLEPVRRIASQALAANPNLIWSWVLLYVAESASAEHDAEMPPATILRRITYLNASQFTQPELEELLGPRFKALVSVPGEGVFAGAQSAQDARELLEIFKKRQEESSINTVRAAIAEGRGEAG